MPPKKRPGMTPLYIEITDEMATELQSLADNLPLGGKAEHVRLALRRHMDNPPTVTVPPLPPITVPGAVVEPEAKPAPKKGKGEKK